ncbi:hypothetical protein Tco_1484004 [Tanacetum coccineum]
MVFHQMDTEEVSDRFVAPCLINRLEAYDGEINFGVEENMISNEYAVKLCLEHEVKRGNRKNSLSFLRMTKAIADFRAGTIIIYPEFDPFLEDVEEEEKRTSSSAGGHLTQEEAGKEALAIRISQKFALLVEKDKVELDGKIVKEEEEAIKRIKGEALKEKDDPGAFIFPIRLEGKAEAMGILINVLCQVGVATLIAKFLILDIPIDRDAPIVVGRGFLHTIGGIVNTPERFFSTFDGFCHQTFRAARSDVMRNAESDSDDEKEYEIKRNKFGAPIYGPKPAPYLNCNDLAERSLAIQTVTNPFRKISVWKKAVSFLGSLHVPLKQVNWKPDYKGCYTKKEEATGQLWEHTMMRPDHQDPNALDNMKPWKRYCFHKFIMSYFYGKDATEMQSLELCHEFYSTYEFDEVCADDELQTKKIIKFRLGRRAHNLTLLEFARRLGFHHVDELEKDGFNVYFEGGLYSDGHFNAQEYWTTGYDKIQKNDLWLLIMFDARHQNGYANVAWLIARKSRVLTNDVIRSLSAPIYCRDLDTTSLRDLIDSEGRLIPDDPQPGVPRVGIPRPPRASMQDLYDRMGRMEIRQEAIERIEYRLSYHWNRYHGVFEHMDGVYSVPLQGAYNPPGYAQPQYD